MSFAGYAALRRRDAVDIATVLSVAVLPLEVAADSTYADALTEELIRRLSREGELEVTARTSAFRFKGAADSPEQVARQLGVQALLAGSVRRDGDVYVVSIELVDGRTGGVLWSPEAYRVAIADALQVQDRIAQDLLAQLQVGRTASPARSSTGTESQLAANLYTLGLERLNRRTDRDLREALSYFQRATEADSNYAEAFAGLAQTYALLPTVGDFDPTEAFTRGMTSASMAISLEPMLGEAHAAVGQLVQNYDWQPSAALRSYERAIEFSPSSASAHQWYAEALLVLGRVAEAEQEINAAIKLDPLSPSAMNTQAQVQVARGATDPALMKVQYEQAIGTLLNETSLFPDYRPGHMTLALTAALAQRWPELRSGLKAYAGTDARLAAQLAIVAAGVERPGRRQAARQALAALEPPLGSSTTALWYAALQDLPAARAALERAFQHRADPTFPYKLVHPLLRELHRDSAYQAIVADVGVKPQA
ncbi:MAG: tetratricopeptide repeat protein [Gemmatimonadetes bacterium]|nr:tetratricopeptide repeat protein [Gemmatimonadota bacterium]